MTLIMRISLIIKTVVISLAIGLFYPTPVQGQVAAPPYLLDAKSKQLKKLRGKVTDIWNDSKKSKEISQKSIDEMLASYSEVEQKASADLPSAAYLVSNAYAVIGDRDTQMKYLDIINSNYDKSSQPVKVLSRIDLGWNNYRGFGTPKNEEKALEYFIQSFELDSIQGAFPMALASLYGIGSMPVDFSLSAQLLLKSKHGLRWPLIYAINYYLDNVEKNPGVQQAWEDYLTGFEIYTIYAQPDQAMPFIKKSMEAGFLPAYQLLGDMYLEKGDRETAIATINPAVEAFYIPALHQKGWYIYSGTFGRLGQWKPITEAYDLFLEAANAGYPPSQVTVAELCLVGSAGVVKIDNEMAFKQASAAQEVGEPLGADLAQRAQKAMTKEKIDNLCKGILALKSSVNYYSLLNRQKIHAKQAEAARNNRQGGDYTAPGNLDDKEAASLAHAAASSQEAVNNANRNNFSFYQWQKSYNRAISQIIKIESEIKSKNNRYGYTLKDLENAKRNARETREKANSYGRRSNLSVSKSKHED